MRKIIKVIFSVMVCLSVFTLVGCLVDFEQEYSAGEVIDASVDDSIADSTEESTDDSTEEVTYTVIFDSGGGTEISPQEIKDGECAVEPSAPTKAIYVADGGAVTEYEFVGWYDGETQYDFTSAVTEDVELTARYNEIKLFPEVSGRR